MKSRQVTTDEMFEPLKQTIELLKTYDQEMPENIHKQLEVIYDKFKFVQLRNVLNKHDILIHFILYHIKS